MKPINIRYDDYRHFIQMDKDQWLKLERWLKAHGTEITKSPTDGPVTKYRALRARAAQEQER